MAHMNHTDMKKGATALLSVPPLGVVLMKP